MKRNNVQDELEVLFDNVFRLKKDQVDAWIVNRGVQLELHVGYSWSNVSYKIGVFPTDISEEKLQKEIIRLYQERRDEILEKLDASYTRDEGIWKE